LALAPVAQRIEQLPSKQTVGGSTPSGGTISYDFQSCIGLA
jgi:hypothetical protein